VAGAIQILSGLTDFSQVYTGFPERCQVPTRDGRAETARIESVARPVAMAVQAVDVQGIRPLRVDRGGLGDRAMRAGLSPIGGSARRRQGRPGPRLAPGDVRRSVAPGAVIVPCSGPRRSRARQALSEGCFSSHASRCHPDVRRSAAMRRRGQKDGARGNKDGQAERHNQQNQFQELFGTRTRSHYRCPSSHSTRF
jgi:hypothetical protein